MSAGQEWGEGQRRSRAHPMRWREWEAEGKMPRRTTGRERGWRRDATWPGRPAAAVPPAPPRERGGGGARRRRHPSADKRGQRSPGIAPPRAATDGAAAAAAAAPRAMRPVGPPVDRAARWHAPTVRPPWTWPALSSSLTPAVPWRQPCSDDTDAVTVTYGTGHRAEACGGAPLLWGGRGHCSPWAGRVRPTPPTRWAASGRGWQWPRPRRDHRRVCATDRSRCTLAAALSPVPKARRSRR